MVLKNIYFIFWMIIQYNFLYFAAQIAPALAPGAPAVRSCELV